MINKDIKRFHYVLEDDSGDREIINSKYLFTDKQFAMYIEEAKEHYCNTVSSIAKYLIEYHEFERFEVQIITRI